MNIKYAIVKNEMPASSSSAKYLGKIIPNGVRNRTQMVANIIANEHFSEATVSAVLDAAVSLTEELCAAGSDVDWGPVKFLAKMHGSLPYEDSEFGDGTASLSVDADATNATRAVLDTLTPLKVSADEIESSVKVSNVMDVATEQFGVIVGDHAFLVLGNGLTLDGEGEYVKAYDKKTGAEKGAAEVVSVSKGQRATCRFSPQLGDGEFTLEIATKGLIGETTPRTFRKSVTSVYAEPEPTITGAKSDGQPDGTIQALSTVTFTGSGLRALETGERLTVEGSSDDFTEIVVAEDGKSMTARAGDYDAGTAKVVMLAADGSVITSFTVTVVAA